MRKHGFAVLGLAAVLSFGAGLTAYAAEGWAQENSQWVYLDSSGNRYYNVWKKGADGLWRYVDGSGVMAVDTWVDDTYYVDSNGIMVANNWLKIEPTDTGSDANTVIDGYNWYFFNEQGKAATAQWKEINGKKYYFDDDHKLLTGWILENLYYCGTDGAMKTGWQHLFPPDDENVNNNNSAYETPQYSMDDDMNWYYFQTNGRKVVPTMDGYSHREIKINNKYYAFDENGAMATGWTNMSTTDDSNTVISDWRYFNDDGTVRTGWYSLEPAEALASNYENAVEWFYFNTNGVPKFGKEDGRLSSTGIYKIGKYSHLFNEWGVPVYGLQKVYIGSTDKYTAYYLGERSQSTVMTGKCSVTEGDGSKTAFYFTSSGQGFTGVHDGYLYYMGKVQKADSSARYDVISFENGNGGKYTNYVVGTSGKIAKNTTVKSADGVKYTSNSSGILTKVDGEAVGEGEFTTPTEPVWQNE